MRLDEKILTAIFGEPSIKEKMRLNNALEQLYGDRDYTVELAVGHYDLDMVRKSTSRFEKLVELVTLVRAGAEPLFFAIDQSKLVKYWYVNDLSGNMAYCIRVDDEAEWKRVTEFMARKYKIDSDWGTFRSGISKFEGPDIYLFDTVKEEYTIDNPDSNYHGCKSHHTFLYVQKYSDLRKKALLCLNKIIRGEADPNTDVIE